MNELELIKAREPTRLERALTVVSPNMAINRYVNRQRMVEFSWHAARPTNSRGNSGGQVANAASENPMAQRHRIELMWDARDLVRNMPILRCARERLVMYTCGSVRYQSETGDPELDSQYESYFEEWAEHYADATGRHNFEIIVSLALGGMLTDGDFGLIPVDNGEFKSLQMIEGDRIGNPQEATKQNDPKYVSGIHLNDLGQVTQYDIYRRENLSRYVKDQELAPGQFYHLFNPLRADQVRGFTWFAPVLQSARDLYETFAFERGAAKWAASHAGVIYEDNGRMAQNIGAADFDGLKQDGTPTSEIQPNKLLRLKGKERVNPFPAPNRPSGAFEALIQATIQDIAMGLNLPYGFFDMQGFGGATARIEVMQAHRTIQSQQRLLQQKVLDPIKNLVLANGIARGHIPPTPNWRWGKWNFGAHLTADRGYDTNADTLLLANGLKTGAAIAAQQGNDYEDMVMERGRELAFLRQVAEQHQIPVELLNPSMPMASELLANMQRASMPPPEPTVDEVGDKVTGQILEVMEQVATGQMPREQAIQMLITLYHMPPARAQKIVPPFASAKVEKKQLSAKAKGAVELIRRPVVPLKRLISHPKHGDQSNE